MATVNVKLESGWRNCGWVMTYDEAWRLAWNLGKRGFQATVKCL